MGKQIRNCGNCFFWKGLEVTGECEAPVPACLRFVSWRKTMFSTEGTQCAAHRMKSVRREKVTQEKAA